MSRLFLRTNLWLCLSVLALAAAAPRVHAQNSVNVTATASSVSPDWEPAPMLQSDPPATASLNASISNMPTPPYNCTLNPPTWEWGYGASNVQYSADNITWTSAPANGYSTMIVQPSRSSSSATLQVWYLIGGYWKFPCSVQVNFGDQPCGDYWFGSAVAVADGTSVQLTNLTVVSGATTTNVTAALSWAAVKVEGGIVIAQATTVPNNEDAWAQILWTNGTEGASANQRNVDKGTSARTIVTAQVGHDARLVNIYIIWAELTIQIAGNAAADNNCPELMKNGGNWDPKYGGGKALGAKDRDSLPGLTYAYTIGQMQATGKLTPAGIGSVISTNAWKLKRTVEGVGWDNGGHYTNPNDDTTWAAGPSFKKAAGSNDTSQPAQLDLDPTSGGSVDTIYDEDAPGCSAALIGTTIYHSSEIYANFTQFVTVTLDVESTCSDNAYWSYQAQVDGDAVVGVGRINLNKLDTQLIKIPGAPHYAKRN